MSAEPTRDWNAEQLAGESVTKKQLVEWLQANATPELLKPIKLDSDVAKAVKASKKEVLIEAYNQVHDRKFFKNSEGASSYAEFQQEESKKREEEEKKLAEEKANEPIGYTKSIKKNGDKKTFPKKGDNVSVRYRGTLEDGKVFDENMTAVKKKLPPPLKFKVGTGKVIRGWDEGLLTMSVGEVAVLTIEPHWAYGKKGIEGRIPPNSVLIFEVELLSIDN
eukprot:TRINITY_DN15320_c0_g1_i1.p1 TRINITY_DN15320_c0_g1~~TRINITY_DN15320_c0_g1_i1.p1  ORF type:complete len:231 (+),score=109.97 TRINITY_DN15320_c0_g1_i1:32-694(+)